MNDFTNIIMGDSDSLEKRGNLFIYGIEERVNSSLNHIKNKYSNYTEFLNAVNYIEHFHSDTIKADIESLYRLGYYPATETEMEFDYSIKHALIGSYKSAFSDLRRALELSIIFVYLSSEQVERKKAVDWIKSRSDTPGFSKAITKLIKNGRFKKIDNSCNWKKNLQNLYWQLSDFSHNKGQLKGYRELNSPTFFTAGSSAPSIKNETLELFCDFYIQTVKEIVVIQSLYNPIILVGVPFDEKFGLEGPMSGFLNDFQAESVNQLIPEKYRHYFDDLIKNDEEVDSIINYFDSLPDLTKEDIEKQAKSQDEFFSQMKTDNKENQST
ncbi:MAG: hypothetical protein DRJ01_16010 [Bacteroidetes bacterium]|nr:MAG: hypothetical protein DRJ01_16010 [Bacteroidota bacterium]